MRRRFAVAVTIILMVLVWMGGPGQADEPVVRVVLFYSETCPHCHEVLEDVLPPLRAQYGQRLEVRAIEISATKSYETLLRVEAAYGVSPDKGVVPEIFVGEHVLFGTTEIRQRLPELIDQYLQRGGTAWPRSLEAPPQPTEAPSASKECHVCDEDPVAPAAAPTAAAPPPVHLAYFFQTGCRECDRARYDLRYLEDRYPQLEIHEYDVKEQAGLAEWLGQRANVALSKRLTAPSVFVGADALVGEQVNAGALEAVIQRYLATGSDAYWTTEGDAAGATAGILSRFRSFGVLTVVAAGLIDGLNPCAFATIVFFISYLSFSGRKGRETLIVGSTFALGVFLTYLGVGVGLLKSLAALPFLPALSRYLYGFTALLCLVLAAGSLYDWQQARRGRPEEMKLKLPLRLRRWVNRVIREGANVEAIAGVAFVTGVAVSLIELACTGQVYLPTILFVLGVPALRVRAVLYLLLYNALFVAPLVAVFLLAYWGTTSERLAIFVNRRTGAIKLATAGLFLLLGAWMVAML